MSWRCHCPGSLDDAWAEANLQLAKEELEDAINTPARDRNRLETQGCRGVIASAETNLHRTVEITHSKLDIEEDVALPA
jgi:hypothetical protein